MKKIIKYVIGIDGGGTKTLGTSYDFETKKLINSASNGPSNYLNNNEQTFDNISKTINKLLIPKGDCLSISLGIAGLVNSIEKEKLKKRLFEKFNIPIYLYKDAEYAALSNFQEQDGIMCIAGTGSAIILKHKNKLKLFGGWGHILGDEGSAYKIAIEFLKMMLVNEELSKPLTLNEKNVLKYLKISTRPEIIIAIAKLSKAEIASIVALLKNDKNLKLSIEQNAIELFNTASRVFMYDTKIKEINLALYGGAFKNKYYKDYFINLFSKKGYKVNLINITDLNKVSLYIEDENEKLK